MEQNDTSEWYYWQNYQFLLIWIMQRYADLLLPDEKAFCEQFHSFPRASQTLLVRLLMRKGLLFRERDFCFGQLSCNTLK